jgi:signal transduction histidine kinase
MSTEEFIAIHDDQRVTRVFPARSRGRDRGEALAEARVPDNDSFPAARGPALFRDLGSRLDEAFEQKLFEPFTRIRTVAAVLMDDPGKQHADQSSAIGEAAGEVEQKLREILDFMRIAAGELRIARRRVDLKVLCERVVDAIHSAYAYRQMLFTSDSRVEGQWDPDRMATLLTSLVLNALQHGLPRPAVRVELRGTPDHVVLQVWNAGSIGDPDLAHRLFEPFVCGRVRQAGTPEGLGLGLFLAREIAWAHGGHIDVQSTEKEGTTFRVTVPRS